MHDNAGSQTVIKKVTLAVFKDKKLMMVRSHKNPKVFYTVGGKIELGESEIESLKRETKEEISVDIEDESIKLLERFEAPAHGKINTMLQLSMYEAQIIGEPMASNEIAEIEYFDSSADPSRLSEMGKDHIIPWLKANNYIN